MRSDQTMSVLYFVGLALLVIALPLSKFLMSVSQFVLVGILIIDGVKKEDVNTFYLKNKGFVAIILTIPLGVWWAVDSIVRKFRQFFRSENLPAVIFSSLYLLHIAGLFYTSDLDYALKDLRIKFPIFLLPFVLSTMPTLDRPRFRKLMIIFSGAVLLATFISIYFLVTEEIDDIRNISRFISHIRFSLLICIAIFILGYWITRKKGSALWMRIAMIAVLVWFIIYLIIATSITGLVILVTTGAVLLITLAFQVRKSWTFRSIFIVVLLGIVIVVFSYLISIVNDVYVVHPVDVENIDKTTDQGNPYWHNFENEQTENGHYVYLYICMDELHETWNQRSNFDFDGFDKKNQELRYTLIRFLTSKGFRKDATGVNKLTDEEIGLIEEGEASILYHERAHLYVRIYKIIWEYQRYQATGNASGHSVMQRFEYWKTSLSIIKANLYFGVGTGDVDKAFKDQYSESDTLLDEKFQWRSHNQFLAIGVGFGLLGILWFLISLLYPPISTQRFSDYFYLSFFVIILMSMFSEDTIESQAGVSIFAFFSSLYLFAKKFHDSI